MKLTGKVQHGDVMLGTVSCCGIFGVSLHRTLCLILPGCSVGANSQSLAQYSASLQAIADQYSKWLSCSALRTADRSNRSSVEPRQASMVASMAREGDLGTLVFFAR